jgi:tetratricopeptide (TPR) repeat protein
MMAAHERIIRAAEGYLELRMFSDVWRELHSLPAEHLGSKEVLIIFLHSLMGERRWEDALTVARRLRSERPEEPDGVIHEAYCLHELGMTREALDLLLGGPPSLRQRAVFFYNAGCYYAQLGELKEAIEMLQKSFEMDETLKRSAKLDSDLTCLKELL